VLGHLLAALETKAVATGQRKRLLVLVIVGFEADSAFKYGLHLLVYLINNINLSRV